MLSIAKLTLDLEPVLHGVDRMPVIGWEIESDNRNVKQVSYWLQIAQNEYFNAIIFDSGKVNSEISNNVDIGEIALLPSMRYFVRVQVQDNHGETSEWSQAATFITGLLNAGWQAEFYFC
jgi:alpha-L-rhamnosidase